MAKLVAIYRKPEDVAQFDHHYETVHTPLAKQMPGLIELKVSKIYGTPMGESDLYLIAEMYFENMDALKQALSSPEGRAAGKDLAGFARNLVTMHLAEEV